MEPDHFFEDAARSCGYQYIAGLDEAGRGPLAGPVVASAVILPRRFQLPRLNDSTVLNETKREQLFDQIINRATSWSIGIATEQEIDALNILQATRLAFLRAVRALSITPDYLLNDAIQIPDTAIPQRAIGKGDSLSLTIAAASILAKVTRDRYMVALDSVYPQYGFGRHKGYSTAQHLAAIQTHGPIAIHRHTFAPIKQN